MQRLSYSMFPKFDIAAANAAQEFSPGDKGSHGTVGNNVVTNTPRRPVQEVSPSKYDELGRLSRPSNYFLSAQFLSAYSAENSASIIWLTLQ